VSSSARIRSAARRAFGLLLVLLLCPAACTRKPGDPAVGARAFFDQVIAGDTAAAYKAAAFGFQAQQSEKAFSATTRELGLVGGKLQSLTVDESSDKAAKLRAELVSARGEPRPFVVRMQWESDAWRVFSLRAPRDLKTGVSENRFSLLGKSKGFTDAVNKSPPSERQTRKIVHDAMLSFAEAIKTQSFHDFYTQASKAWQSQLTENQLQRAFQAFIDQGVNLSGVADVEPAFDAPPRVTTDGLLLVSGHYPTKPFEVVFAFKFVYELPEWKLFGVDVFLRKAASADATPAPGATPAAPAAPTTPPPAAP
jgi:hypothetical protein